MCGVCGCNNKPFSPVSAHANVLQTQHHHHQHDEVSAERLIKVEQAILAKNDSYAAKNRQYFQEHDILALNFVSSPGAGKTTLLVSTINALKQSCPIAVIEGDQQTELDADRIRATGVNALQINTGKACHLDAHEITHAIPALDLAEHSLLAIENVGNLVCPSSFDLGEAHKVVILSVTEGDDKPLKYPDMFHAADLMIINKIDLLPYTNFNVERCIEFAKRIKPDIEVLQLSATQEQSLTPWLSWLQQRRSRSA